jgi:hypothetical protein
MKKTIIYAVIAVALMAIAASARTLSPSELKQDFAVFQNALLELHPGLYRYSTADEIKTRFDEFESKLGKPMPETEFFVLVSEFVSSIRCGHTYTNPFNQKKEVLERLTGGRHYFPFYFEFYDGMFIVTENASEANLPAGSAITSINGIGVDEIAEKLLGVTTADGFGTQGHRFASIGIDRETGASFALFDIYFPMFFPLPEDGVFKVEATDFKTQDELAFSVPAMTQAERTAEMEKRYGKTPGYDEGWEFKFLDDGSGYLKIYNFITWKLSFDFKKFLADAFAKMRERRASDLIIDIRGSDGGDDNVYRELLRYLHKQPFDCRLPVKTYIRTAKADPELLKYITAYGDDVLAALKNGLPKEAYKETGDGLLEYLGDGEGNCKRLEPYADHSTGKTYLLIGPSNASAAFTLPYRVQQAGLATLIGQSTGGNKKGFNGGAYLFVSLPNSGFEFDIPVFAFKPLEEAEDSGVVPDLKVWDTPDDIAAGRDSALEKAKALIAAGKTKDR